LLLLMARAPATLLFLAGFRSSSFICPPIWDSLPL
jgi:hypothetical protein